MKHIDKYTSETNPELWLSDYLAAIQMSNGDDFNAIKHLPLKLFGSSRAWLNTLLSNLVFC